MAVTQPFFFIVTLLGTCTIMVMVMMMVAATAGVESEDRYDVANKANDSRNEHDLAVNLLGIDYSVDSLDE